MGIGCQCHKDFDIWQLVRQTNQFVWLGIVLMAKYIGLATYRSGLKAEEIVYIYKLQWNIEIFFGWWKRHLKVYSALSQDRNMGSWFKGLQD